MAGVPYDGAVVTKADGKGTGLGLAVARGIVEAHGGSLTAATHDKGGAVMQIRMPEGRG